MSGGPRIGVFLCECEGQIAFSLDVDRIRKKLAACDDVATVATLPYGCSPDGEQAIKDGIKANGLDRVVVLGCSPRIMGSRFRRVCAAAGLNPSLLEIVNLRDQCAWVHQTVKADATRKAWSMIQLGLARIRKLTPAKPTSAKIRPATAVVGGGVAGLTAALSLAEQGIGVTLIEQSGKLGGGALELAGSTPWSRESRAVARKLTKAVDSSPNVTVLTNSRIVGAAGTYGDYRLTLDSGNSMRTVECSAIILATGTEEPQLDGKHGHGTNPKVITQSELELRLADQRSLAGIRNVVMLQCVGARNQERPYCGRTCCLTAVNNAVVLKEQAPNLNVTILHRGIPAEPRSNQMTIDRATELGVRFVRVIDETEPRVTAATVSGTKTDDSAFRIPYDLVVLSTPSVPREESRHLAEWLRIPVDEFGFIPDTLPDLKPHAYAKPAIRVAGSAHWPCTTGEASYQAYGRAAQIAALVQAGEIASNWNTAWVNTDVCRGCATCFEVCPYDVPVIQPVNGSNPVSTIDPLLCKGCGLCVVHCPSGAATMTGFDDGTAHAAIEAALLDRLPTETRVLAFLCEWSGYAAADLAGVKRRDLPVEVVPVRIPCGGRLSIGLVLHSFLHGADGVIACVCEEGDCHYRSGNSGAARLAAETEDLLGLLGINKQCFRMVRVSPEDYQGFARSLEDFVHGVKSVARPISAPPAEETAKAG